MDLSAILYMPQLRDRNVPFHVSIKRMETGDNCQYSAFQNEHVAWLLIIAMNKLTAHLNLQIEQNMRVVERSLINDVAHFYRILVLMTVSC